ncbi:hypothetical protein CDL12_29244 [Handroanthus impetiginosus]|uniref:C-terminal of Roc COR-B domain-containing protein n=1 Tax=Handroanthus impetiginosus TaxID=429701 RepID=A0A2G9G048_9LAMI|nr:hypothetical protein CDL12_29244 [Handroanthus impetiginosus]
MATNQNARDLQWALQVLKSRNLDLQSVSFFLSQPNSCCLQETERSMNLSITKDTLLQFSQFLKVLGTDGKNNLRNLEFHLVEWELQQMKDLRMLLENNPNIKQLMFRRNKFNVECLSELSDSLRKNKCIKEIMLSESGIGSEGAGILASALKDNHSVEELQIWEDSIGSKGAEELSKMIEANSTLKLLTIFDSKSITATPLISAVLARNRSMEVHIWSVDRNVKSLKVVEFVPENSTLRVYNLDISGACRLACSLGLNSTVRSLDMTGVRLKSRWAKEFRWVLEQNRSLREVNLSKTCLKDKGVVYVAAGLFKNQSLEKLYLEGNWFGGIGIEHLLCPLSKFSTLQNQANMTLKSITLGGGRTKIGRDGLAAILQMLTSNQSVTHLGICDDESLRPDDIIKIFKSLERNATLRCISLQGCKGVKGELVLQTIMETLNVNPWIEDIDLARTPLQVAGKTEGIYQRLGQNEKTEPEIDLLKDMAMTVPKSSRVFLCGQEYAGKSTLCNSISQNISRSKLPYLDQVRILVNPVEQAVRTPGMKIKTFKDEDIKISIWNLAGQHEFYSLHDLMFPGHGSASFFLIISSLFKKPSNRQPKNPTEIEEDLQYWLRFIVSNSRRAVQQCMLPSVTIVLTHYDKVNQQADSLQATVSLIQRLRDKFEGFVELYPTVFTVDARSSASVSKLSHHIRKTSRTILERVPRVYQLCNDLVEILSDWRHENRNKPAMRWKEFGELCQVKVPYLRIRSRHDNNEKIEMRRRAVATSLHHIGEVIYFDKLGFLVLDCEWFCGEVLSQLILLDVKKQSSAENSGFICRKDFEKILVGSLHSHIPGMGSNVMENLEAEDLIKMMLKLELCCEQDPSDPNSPLLIPSNLEEGRRKPQRWPVNTLENNYIGRRLQCDDSIHMFLTAGFFPRLQVHLYNKIMGLRNQHGASYSLEKYLISININGIYVRVELGGQLGYSIDVLACSTKSTTEMLRLFQHLIIPAVQSVSHGISLSEYVIRSECVKNLIPPRYRRNQFVHLQQLKQALLSVPAESIYDYQHTWDSITESGNLILGPGFDFARDLLSDDEFKEVLHSRYHDLYNLAVELQVPQENNPDRPSAESDEITSSVEPSFSGIAKGVEAILQRLKIIEQEIKDIKQEIQGLRYYEHRLLIELHRKMNYLVNYNIQLEERKVPNMFYFVRTENYSRRLITNMISGMTALRLHMLCEFRREMHVVEDQIGCELMQVDNITVKCLAPYMTKFMKLLTFALKIGAHLAAGMGEMIPDLGREVAHLIDSPMLYGAAGAAAAGAAGAAAAARNRNRSESSRDIQQDLKAAQQWVVDFLRDQRCSTGKDIAEKFGLFRVRYRDDGQIAWICRRHMHTRAYEIIEAPI